MNEERLREGEEGRLILDVLFQMPVRDPRQRGQIDKWLYESGL